MSSNANCGAHKLELTTILANHVGGHAQGDDPARWMFAGEGENPWHPAAAMMAETLVVGGNVADSVRTGVVPDGR